MKHSILFLFTVAFSSAVFGQVPGGYGGKMSKNDNTNKIDIGVLGSPSIRFLRGNEIIKDLHRPTFGFSGGIFFQYNFRKVFSIRTDIAFERKGSVASGNILMTDNNGNFIESVDWKTFSNFDYLTAPVLLRASLGKKIKYFANVGVFFSYLIKQTFDNRYSNTFPNNIGDNTDLDKRFDTGISAGLGLTVPINTKFSISLEIRNNLGLYNVSKVPVINDGTIKTNSTNLLFGFTYKLGARQYIVPAY